MLPPIAEVGAHIDARRLLNLFEECRDIYNNNLTILVMAQCMKYSVLTLYLPGIILFQTMLVSSEGILVPNISYTPVYLTSLRILRRVATQ
jgi:hypothetical protein